MAPAGWASLLAAGLAAAAVWAAWPDQASRVRHPEGRYRPERCSAVRRWLRGRPDGVSPSRRLWLAVGAAAAAVFVVGSAAPAPGWLGVVGFGPTALGVWVLLGRVERGAVRRRHRRLVLDAPAALELLAACLAAGLPPRNATAAVVEVFDGPVGEDIGAVLAAVDVGVSDAAAWRALRTHPQFGAAAVDLARCVDSGTRMVETLRHHARDAARQRHAALEVSAKAVGVRSVLPLMTCFIPAFLLLGVVPTLVSAIARALP